MTGLTRKVRRKVPAVGRGLVIELNPASGGTVTVREARRRAGFTVTIAGLYTMLALRAANLNVSRRRGGRR